MRESRVRDISLSLVVVVVGASGPGHTLPKYHTPLHTHSVSGRLREVHGVVGPRIASMAAGRMSSKANPACST